MLKEHFKDFTEISREIYTVQRIPSTAEVKPYWKSLWEEKASNNERAEWI